MNLRCKPGDIAMITWDHEGCYDNIGRLVEVGGPIRIEGGVPKWWIKPVTPEMYKCIDVDGSVCTESVGWKSKVVHPDSWMQPIRPGDDIDIQTRARDEQAVPLNESAGVFAGD
jgi:hypothetical protein